MQKTELILSVILILLIIYEVCTVYLYRKKKQNLEETVEKYEKQIYLNHRDKTNLEIDYRNKCLELSQANAKIESQTGIIQSLRKKERQHKYLLEKQRNAPTIESNQPPVLHNSTQNKSSKNSKRTS